MIARAMLVMAGLLGGATPAAAVSFDLVVGAGGGSSQVATFETPGPRLTSSFPAYPGFSGGVYVAAGDLDGDGRADVVTGAGATGGPHVKVFSGATGGELRSFFAYDVGFTGGVRVAVGDVTGDGTADIVTGAGVGGGPHVKVFDGATGAEIRSFFAFEQGYTGGVFVAAGDVNGDGAAELIVGADRGSSHVRVFDGGTGAELASFFGGAPNAGGGGLAIGRYAGADALFVGAGVGSAPVVNIFSLTDFALIGSQLAFDPGFLGGVSVAAGDFGGDDAFYAGMLTGGGALSVFDAGPRPGRTLAQLTPFGADYTGGLNVAALAAVVPEPASWGLMIAGIGAAGGALRRRGAGRGHHLRIA